MKPRVCAYFAGFWGVMRMETCQNGNSNMLYFSARIRRVPAYMPVALTCRVNKLVLEGVARPKYDATCCFCERLSTRLGTHEPQAHRVHPSVVNTALGCKMAL